MNAPVALLPLFCPIPPAIHPAAAEIERHCVAWIDRFELYGGPASRERLIETRAAEIYARALPTADAERVADVAKWLYWGFATDDLLYDAGPASADASAFLALGAPLVRIAEEPRARFAHEPPYSAALRDLATAISRHASPRQRLDWAHTARGWFFGMAWDVAHAERGLVPSLNDYLAMRMHTGGLASWVTTLQIAHGIDLPDARAADPRVRALTEAWSTLCLFLNDLMSYAKEALLGERSSNLITVVAAERGCSPQQAVPHCHALCDRIAGLVRRLIDELRAEVAEHDPLAIQLRALEHTWRGILDWGFASPRYMEDGAGRRIQEFPGWAAAACATGVEPLPHPSVAWWWDEPRPAGREAA